MPKPTTIFVCQSCGSVHGKWAGRCDACGEWNTLVEEAQSQNAKPAHKRRKGRGMQFVDLGGESKDVPRLKTGIDELDRVTGGGLVPGSAILVGGDPGIGKSTLLLQATGELAARGLKTAYISGEESTGQVRRRAKRLGVSEHPVSLASETSLGPILDGLMETKPDVIIIDSIQTLWTDQLGAAPGTVAQVRACGPTDEIGVFEMRESGLAEVPNPSALFLDGRGETSSGAAVFAGLEGSRPVLTEIQALVAPAAFGTPRRSVVGWDSSRLAMVLAVLETRCGVSFAGKDVYLNVAGGLRINEPAADLAVAAAIASSAFDVPLPSDSVVFGEISLSGDVRPVGRANARLKEAAKLGFHRAITAKPQKRKDGRDQNDNSVLPIIAIKALPDLIRRVEASTESGALMLAF